MAVVERFEPPDVFDGVSLAHLLQAQHAIDGKEFRYSCQSERWVGNVVAPILGLDSKKNKARIKKMVDTWISNGALLKTTTRINSRETPIVVVGEWANE